MSGNTLYVGGGAGIIGLVAGFLLGGPDEDKLAEKIGAQLAAGTEQVETASAEQFAEMNTALAALDARITGLNEQLAINAEQQAAGDVDAAEKLDAAVAALEARLGAVSTELGEKMTASGAEQSAKLEAALAGGMANLQGALTTMATTPAPAATEPLVAAPQPQPQPVPEPVIEGTRVGETESLLGGAARVFVSGIDEAAGIARVAVNGTSVQMLGSYHEVVFEVDGKDCMLQLDDILQGHVQISASCAE